MVYNMKDKFLLASIFSVGCLTVLLYMGIIFGHNLIPIDFFHYQGAYHVTDSYNTLPSFDFFRSLAAWDDQWYFSIATSGYSTAIHEGNRTTFAFFPLYPLILHLFSGLTGDTFIAAAILSIFLLFVNTLSGTTLVWTGYCFSNYNPLVCLSS